LSASSLGCTRGVVAGGQIVGAAVSGGEASCCCSCCGREEEVACAGSGADACCGGVFVGFPAALVAHGAHGHGGFAVGVFVELGLWGAGSEEGLGVAHCSVLGECCALDGAVEGPGDETPPEENAHGHEA